MGTGGPPGDPRGRGRGPTLVARVWAPSGIFFAQYFLLFLKITSVEFQDFWSCGICSTFLKSNKLQKYFPILKIVWNFTFCLSRICSTFLKIYHYCLRFFKNVPNSKNILVLAICSKVENNIYIKETHFRKKIEF